jgi:hypothetical protein
MTWHSLSSPGFPRFEFPCFNGNTECSDVPPLIRPRFGFPSFGRTFPCACVRSHGPDAGPGAWSFGSGSPTPETAERQRRDLSGSWGILLCICRVLRPRRDRLVRTYDGVGAAPVLATTKAPANLPSFEAQSHGVCTRCLRFVLGITPPGRKTRFPLLSALRGGISYPQDSNERFPSCFLHLFLLSQACLTQCQRVGSHHKSVEVSEVS